MFQKIAKSNYSKKQDHIKNHDASVQKNWIALKKGEMTNLPEKLTKHLQKFSDRSSINLKPYKMPDKIEVIRKSNVSTEFSDIITSYEKLKNKSKNEETEEPIWKNANDIQDGLDDSGNNEKKENKPRTTEKFVTLQQLRHKIQSKIISGEEIPIDDKMILDNYNNRETKHHIVKLPSEEINSILSKTNYQTSSGLTKKTERDYSHLIYPYRIMIPKNKLKHGYTYKLNDCYYDSDGRFLYRVPGMD